MKFRWARTILVFVTNDLDFKPLFWDSVEKSGKKTPIYTALMIGSIQKEQSPLRNCRCTKKHWVVSIYQPQMWEFRLPEVNFFFTIAPYSWSTFQWWPLKIQQGKFPFTAVIQNICRNNINMYPRWMKYNIKWKTLPWTNKEYTSPP